jgi:hypothetical protein
MTRSHPANQWQKEAQRRDLDQSTRLRLAAMAGHMRLDKVTSRRAAVMEILSDGKPHRREVMWELVNEALGRDCWGKRPDETLLRDLNALRQGGLQIAYSRRPDSEGYYLAYPPLKGDPSAVHARLDWQHIAGIRQMSVVEKNRQAFAAAEFALRQKRLFLRRRHPDWDDAGIEQAARQLVYGRHELENVHGAIESA